MSEGIKLFGQVSYSHGLKEWLCPREIHRMPGMLIARYKLMNQSKTITCCLAALILAICTPTHGGGQSIDPSRQRAAALWEEAVRAKGGRERLHSIQNLLISSTIGVRAERGSNVKETERLYVMPGKAWIYTYTPEFDVSLDATVINKERNFC